MTRGPDQIAQERQVVMKDEEKVVDGQSFYNEALTGSGTILPDGTIGEPLPDPTVLRGGPTGERKSPGGVERLSPDVVVPRAQTATPQQRTTSRSAKQGNAKP